MIVTMSTLKRFTRAVGLAFHRMDVQALVTSLAGVCRVDCNQFHAILNALVAQKQSQLIVGKYDRNPLTTTQQCQADGLILLSEVKNPSVVICRSWAKRFHRVPFQLRSFSVSSDSSANQTEREYLGKPGFE